MEVLQTSERTRVHENQGVNYAQDFLFVFLWDPLSFLIQCQIYEVRKQLLVADFAFDPEVRVLD